jgi:hypothetical protein
MMTRRWRLWRRARRRGSADPAAGPGAAAPDAGTGRTGGSGAAAGVTALGAPAGAADSAGDPDFAAEHSSPTVADQMPGGPERARDPEVPRGYAGMDPG